MRSLKLILPLGITMPYPMSLDDDNFLVNRSTYEAIEQIYYLVGSIAFDLDKVEIKVPLKNTVCSIVIERVRLQYDSTRLKYQVVLDLIADDVVEVHTNTLVIPGETPDTNTTVRVNLEEIVQLNEHKWWDQAFEKATDQVTCATKLIEKLKDSVLFKKGMKRIIGLFLEERVILPKFFKSGALVIRSMPDKYQEKYEKLILSKLELLRWVWGAFTGFNLYLEETLGVSDKQKYVAHVLEAKQTKEETFKFNDLFSYSRRISFDTHQLLLARFLYRGTPPSRLFMSYSPKTFKAGIYAVESYLAKETEFLKWLGLDTN